jgi:Ribbon-helix-helix protein, copG family
MPGGTLGACVVHNWYRTVNKMLSLFFGTCSSGFRRNLRGQLCHHYRAMKQRKGQMIKARVSSKMKRGINDLADQRGESEAVIVREALSQYLRKPIIPLGTNSSHRPKKRN